MKKYGLLGEKLGHSFSKQVHNMLANYDYELYAKSFDELDEFLKNPKLSGMNVTIPYKKAVIPYCTHLSDVAKKIGSVNTLVLKDDGWHGDNTDFYGFLYMLKASGISPKDKKVLILGSGGASLTAQYALKELGAAEIVVVSRHGKNNYDNIHLHYDAQIIINTTPVGMYPHCPEAPINLEKFQKCVGVVDIIYNPLHTQLISDAIRLKIPCVNGLSMLVAQAKYACDIFKNQKTTDEKIDVIVKAIESQVKNIILIGMPGSGKSHIGSLLAKSLGRPFVDSDNIITERAGNIETIFAQHGEDYFREIETEVLKEISKQSGQIISTGGGCVTKDINFDLLHQNGVVIWLKRDIKLLPTNGRPLSKSGSLKEMYLKRASLYEKFADFIIDNNLTPEETVNKIKECLN